MSRRWGPPAGRRRPPWWPEGESWPPVRGWGRGRYGPPAFILRFGCLVVFAMFLAAFLFALAAGWVAGRYGAVAAFAFAAAILAFLYLFAAQGMRRFALPIDQLIDAAGRIERGDYSARINERGPRRLRSVAHAFNAMSERLESADKQRRGFLADVVHELRTPLAVIQAQSEAIADGVYPADEEHLAPIVDATHSLEVLVEDLRALALTDTGSLVLHREPVDPGELVRDTAAAFEAQAEAGGVELRTVVADGLPAADVDPVRMRSALGNVVANAIRYTPRGGTVSVATEQAADRIAMVVVDTGPGISKELLPHVFERFARGPESKGSGLGLAIAHDIVVAHGGRIEVVSTSPSGTTVRITVPIAA